MQNKVIKFSYRKWRWQQRQYGICNWMTKKFSFILSCYFFHPHFYNESERKKLPFLVLWECDVRNLCIFAHGNCRFLTWTAKKTILCWNVHNFLVFVNFSVVLTLADFNPFGKRKYFQRDLTIVKTFNTILNKL